MFDIKSRTEKPRQLTFDACLSRSAAGSTVIIEVEVVPDNTLIVVAGQSSAK